jgi:uncharacterized protein (TIGR02646 family)
MRFIDISSFRPSEEWQEKAKELTQALILASSKEERDVIIDKNAGHWSQIKPKLLKLSYQKCWYSEARDTYSYYHVEHFRPKKKCLNLDPRLEHDGYWWLSFVWENYRICGSVGNTFKGNKFAVKKNQATTPECDLNDEVFYLLDPTSVDDVKLVTFNENGEIKPSNPNENDWSYQRAKYTIETLNLDFEMLKEERKRLWHEMVDLIGDVNKGMELQERSPSASRRLALDKLLGKIREKIAPCSAFSSTYKACLKASREDWALDLLMEHLDPNIYCKHYLEETVAEVIIPP